MSAPECRGSTSYIFPVRPGVIVKQPAEVWKESPAYRRLTEKIANNFLVEQQILEALGAHPRIVKYYSSFLQHAGSPLTLPSDTMDGKTSPRAYAGCSFLKPAIATSNDTLKRTMIAFRSLFGRCGAGRLLNPSHTFTITGWYTPICALIIS